MTENRGVLKRLFRFFVPVLILAWCSSVPAFQNEVVLSQEEARVSGLWESYLEAKATDDPGKVKIAFEEFQRLQKTTASEIFENAAYLFLEEGYRELATGDHKAARSEFLKAAELDRYLWPAYAGLAKIKKEQDRNLQRALYLDFKGISEAFSLENAYFVLDAAVWFYYNLYRVFLFAFIIFAFVLSQKYFRPFYHTAVSGFEEKGMRSLYAALPSFAILLIPLVLGANLFLAGGLYLVLAFPFMNTKERYATGALFTCCLPLTFLILFLANANDARTDPLLRAHLTQYFDGDMEQRIKFLETSPGEGEFQDRSLLALGDLKKVSGDYQEALDVYAKIPQSSELWAFAQINMGNIHYLGKDYQEARDAYDRAMKAEPKLALPYYNLAVVKEKAGNHQEAEAFRNQALKKDSTLGMRSALDRGLVDQDVIDAKPDNRKRLLQAMLGQGNPNTNGWIFDPYFFMPMVLSVILICLALVHLRFRNPSLLAKACERCGLVFFPSDSPNSEWCSQCVSLYIKKEDLPSEAKLQKSEQVRRFTQRKKWMGVILQVLCPGSKKVIGSNAIEGLITIFVWVGLVVFCMYPLTGIQYPFMRFLEGSLIISGLSYGITTVYWLIFGLRPAFGED